MPDPVLACQAISKSFGGVHALRGVDLDVAPGQVHGLLGENGAGKSTLLRILAGVMRPDAGRISLAGLPYAPSGTDAALRQGIVTIHQDINLIGGLSVAENILLNNEPRGRFGLLPGRAMRARVSDLLRRYEIGVDPTTPVQALPNDLKKMIQIIKAMTWDARVLLMDEPTSSLTDVEVRVVLRLVRALAAQGVAIVFVSHYLAEVFEVCDQITVLRDGARVIQAPRAALALEDVVRAMLGRDLEAAAARAPPAAAGAPREVLLSVRDLGVRGAVQGVSFDLHRGEVLGITGLTGSGLTELARALFGAETVRRSGGTLAIDGQPVSLATPHDSLRHGVALLTNDRLREGVLPEFSVLDNICLPILRRFTRRLGLLDRAAMRDTARRCIQRLRVRASGPDAAARTLSGGNQQKLLLAKWLETQPRILLLEEPTIGIDVGSKDEIRRIIEQIAAGGVGIILFSAELADIERLCHRALVMFRGAVIGEYAGAALDRRTLLQASVSGQPA